MLDVDTGGGEWLASLPERPPRTVATESWAANVDVARERLEPLGVELLAADAVPDNVDQRGDEPPLPCADASFELVTARHAAYVPREIARVLTTGGVFLTQQIGGDYGDFHEALGLPRRAPTPRWNLEYASAQLASVGLEPVQGAEGEETTSFADVGALAWYLRLIPWTVEGFSIERYRSNLERAHERIARDGALRVRLPAFWVRALKHS
jgi:SAM-dependent methyltransferase